jgi:hypothetical protein
MSVPVKSGATEPSCNWALAVKSAVAQANTVVNILFIFK